MSYNVPYIAGVSDEQWLLSFQLHQNSTLWPGVFDDNAIFRQLSEEIQLDALPPSTPVQDTTSAEDTTPPDDATPVGGTATVEDATATPVTSSNTPNDNGSSFIFDEYGFRDDHKLPRLAKTTTLELDTGLRLFKDKYPDCTRSSIVVKIELEAHNKWSYDWSVLFSTNEPFSEANRQGDIVLSVGQRCAACVEALGKAISAITEFTKKNYNANPPISNFYVLIPQGSRSKYPLLRFFLYVEQGVPLENDDPGWCIDVYNKLVVILVKMRELRTQGINVKLWQRV